MFDLLWQQSLVGVCLVGKDGKFITANPRACELLEYNESELQSMTFQDITHPKDKLADNDMVNKVLSGERESYGMFKVYSRKMTGWLSAFLWVTGYTKDHQFVCFISQIMPVEQATATTKTQPKQRTKAFAWVKEYWQLLAVIATGASWVIKEVITHLRDGQ